MPSSRQARITRTAISPRLAISSRLNTLVAVSLVGAHAAPGTNNAAQVTEIGQPIRHRGITSPRKPARTPDWGLSLEPRPVNVVQQKNMRATLASTPFVIVDLETTGGSALFDRVVEVAAIRVHNGVVEDRIVKLVEPGVPIPPFIARMTGINDALVRGRPSFDRLLPDLQRLFTGAVLVAHNASFDFNFLSQAFQRAQLGLDAERLCTLRLARRLMPGLPSYKLDSLCAALGFTFVQQHRAG